MRKIWQGMKDHFDRPFVKMCKDYAVMRGKVEQTEKLKDVISNQDAQLKAAQEVMDQLRKQAEDSEARLKEEQKRTRELSSSIDSMKETLRRQHNEAEQATKQVQELNAAHETLKKTHEDLAGKFKGLADACAPIVELLGKDDDSGRPYTDVLKELPRRLNDYCQETAFAVLQRVLSITKLLWPETPLEGLMHTPTAEQEANIEAIAPSVANIARFLANEVEFI